jgi:hypothetical protein
MKLALIAALSLLASCKDTAREPSRAPAAGSAAGAAAGSTAGSAAGSAAAGSAASPADICKIAVAALDKATCPTPELLQGLRETKGSIDRIVETVGQLGGANRSQFQVLCAQVLLAIERDAAKLKCVMAIDPGPRAEITALLDAWYGQRTPVVPTGDAASDAAIARMVAVRDAACECRDAACLDRVDKLLVTLGPFPEKAPDAARTLASKLLEDAARCASRVRTLTGPPR